MQTLVDLSDQEIRPTDVILWDGHKCYQLKLPESGILTWDEVKRQISKIDQLQGGSVDGGDSALDERSKKP